MGNAGPEPWRSPKLLPLTDRILLARLTGETTGASLFLEDETCHFVAVRDLRLRLPVGHQNRVPEA